jgi:hypothetical protein
LRAEPQYSEVLLEASSELKLDHIEYLNLNAQCALMCTVAARKKFDMIKCMLAISMGVNI